MRIAIFDYQVIKTNPIGGCHRRMMEGLADEHEFTVFAAAFDNPRPDRIRWVRVPVPMRPLALLFVTYHLLAPFVYVLYRLRTGIRFDVVQMVESNLSFGDVSYAHFCHASFLQDHWEGTRASGLRGFLRWLDHRLHGLLEGHIFRRVRRVVVPSRGLARELTLRFPCAQAKTQVLPNAIEVARLERPPLFDRYAFRSQLGVTGDEVLFCFAALGHFERKGLPLLLEALSQTSSKRAKLLIIGGKPDLVANYRQRVASMGLTERVLFAGMQTDIHPYLWASDAFAFASAYETFSLAAYEAAAASLPLITPHLHGIEEIVSDGETGYVVERTSQAIATALERFLSLSANQRIAMGRQARLRAAQYDEARFVAAWREFYNNWAVERALKSVPGRSIESVEICR